MTAVLAQARAELALTLRRGESLLVTMAIPLGVLVFFSKVDTNAFEATRPVDFLVPGTLGLAVMSAAMVSLGIATGFERRYGVLKRLGSTPLGRGRLIVAKTSTILAVEVVQAALILLVGSWLGWDPTVGGVLAAIGLVLLGTVAFAGVGMLMAGTLRAEANLAGANALFLVLLFLGDMAYPLDKLPAGLEALGRALPAAALAESLRSVLAPGRPFASGAFTILVVWVVVAPLLAARFFTWEE
jgi:ABC-2 type transport system permease protein